ncbi:MAG: hypothetical protein C0467_04355 [Planctomycetaceae bacterium]|nr:hypothetical protein [Planctomycetaceae bacterium]
MTKTTDHAAPPLVITAGGKTWVWVSVLLMTVGWYKSINLVLLLAYLMFALLLVNGIFARRHAVRVIARREQTLPALAGEETKIWVTVTNVGARPVTVSVEEQAGDHPLVWLVHNLPARESVSCTANILFAQRGRFATRIRVWSEYPLGLLRFGREGERGPDVVVLPAAGMLDVGGMRRWLQQAGGDGRVRKLLRRVTSDEAEVRGVRPFRPGDAIRSVHWRSTARRRELMVREYDVAPSLDLVLVVEPWLPLDPTLPQLKQLEETLCLAVTIVNTWSRVYGTNVVVAVAGTVPSVRSATPNAAGVRNALEPLASVTGQASVEPFGPKAFGRPLGRTIRLLVTSRPESPYADALAKSTGRAFIAVCPSDGLPWYRPPAVGERKSGKGFYHVPLLPPITRVEHPDIK